MARSIIQSHDRAPAPSTQRVTGQPGRRWQSRTDGWVGPEPARPPRPGCFRAAWSPVCRALSRGERHRDCGTGCCQSKGHTREIDLGLQTSRSARTHARTSHCRVDHCAIQRTRWRWPSLLCSNARGDKAARQFVDQVDGSLRCCCRLRPCFTRPRGCYSFASSLRLWRLSPSECAGIPGNSERVSSRLVRPITTKKKLLRLVDSLSLELVLANFLFCLGLTGETGRLACLGGHIASVVDHSKG